MCQWQNIVQEFNLTLKRDYRFRRPSDRAHTERCLTDDEWRIAQREIDWNVESYFGYTPLDCHRCLGDPNVIGDVVRRYAPDPISRIPGGMRKKGGYAATNKLSPAPPKGRGDFQGKTTQSTAENIRNISQKRAAVQSSSATTDSNGPSSVILKGKEKSSRQKRNPFSLPSRK
jgi:hypothetical protein